MLVAIRPHSVGAPWSLGGPSAAEPMRTTLRIRGNKLLDSSAQRQLRTLRGQTVADLQAVLKEEYKEEELRRRLQMLQNTVISLGGLLAAG